MQSDESPSAFGGIVKIDADTVRQLTERPSFDFHSDDERFDRVEIKIVPRYKMSGLSGDEWRRSVLITFYYKDEIVFEKVTGDMETACKILGWCESFGRESDEWKREPYDSREEKCFQPGCSEWATVEYKLRKSYDRYSGTVTHDHEATEGYVRDSRVRFCERHERRGDCGLQDADANYIKVRVKTANGWVPA